ncbi:Pyruvate dehydrogenase E1 component subunit beta, mitochondrial [Parelaphostrongylus tenuis]|uniref:Pyruvate dehydrogenase E1 component subunit beta n=1 Tax=Parelaphostrongylus tenuis TaxID=148309 RepID=A0AAD5M750_PARTN|nr:Pyruvate dehydrogenase E1 component subunit beta, mitochondrial [Parelaphostrongylus tenuis]
MFGQVSCPIVFRGPNGFEPGIAAQHTQDYSAWYSHCPGMKVLAPYSAEDAKGLLKAAIKDDNPVVFLENAVLYDRLFPVPDEVLFDDFVVPIGKCKIEREGNDVTLVSFSRGVEMALEAANELDALGISAEVINLRTLRPLDFETIKESVMKTRRLVTVEEGWPFAGIGAEISAQVSECETWDRLVSPILRVSGADVPTPYAQHLEEQVTANVTHIVATCEKSLKHGMTK